ncbi:hypothetical protein SEA_DARBY_23 [Arthrobacter phage Darby]|uniref:Minor tail protein n=1 Tax=Arthrobacter phage Darby TaxID=2951390 RepID=A0A9E7NII0_9CAUD|nr:hypothetical protein QCN39_gp23 [Arthrobacter phage Darby]UTN92028.1 hypothetical protein SEA_DARBY_23 [Arthrobacter phage Darby]
MAQTPDDPTKAQVWITKGIDDLDFEFYFPQGPKGDPGPFVPVSVLGSSGTNLNDLTAPGTYSVAIPTLSNDSVLQNYPMHEAGSMWVTTSNAGSVVVQQYLTNTKGMYVRRKFSGNWSPWRFFGHSRTDQTAGRAMYQWDEINQREQLIYGDTGWREVSALLVDGWTSSGLFLRRLGSQVFLTGIITGSSATSDHFLSLLNDVGFRPGSQSIFSPVLSDDYTSSRDLQFDATSTKMQVYVRAAPVGKNWRMAASWITPNSWPTSLPGAASGSVPNT